MSLKKILKVNEMSTRTQLYGFLSERIPSALSEEWDNDGIMCIPEDAEVKKVLLSLDATREAVDKAISQGFDLIITHHPMIFRPLRSLVSEKLISLVKNNIAVFSFHTRLDAVDGGVNDELASQLGLTDIEKMSLGRVGNLPYEMTVEEFADSVTEIFCCEKLTYINRTGKVKRVALVGGDGKDFLSEAEEFGADTYLTGNMSYNTMVDADEGSVNVIEAGHYNTEFPVLYALKRMISEFDSAIEVEIFDNTPIITA